MLLLPGGAHVQLVGPGQGEEGDPDLITLAIVDYNIVSVYVYYSYSMVYNVIQ